MSSNSNPNATPHDPDALHDEVLVGESCTEKGPAVVYSGHPEDSMYKNDPYSYDAEVEEDRVGRGDGQMQEEDENDRDFKPICCEKNPVLRRIRGLIPHGGMISNMYNLASATLGAGIVSVSSGFHDSGIVVSIVLLIVVCILTIYSIYLLVVTQEKTKFRSYEEMARGLLGIGWDYFTAFLMFMFCWGTCIGYVGSVQDLLYPLLNDEKYPATPFLRTTTGHRLLTALVWLVGMFSLSLPKEINSLRYVSVVGVTMIVFFVICIIIHSGMNGISDSTKLPGKNINLATSGMEAVNGLTLFIYSFICQVNIFEIYEEMRPATKNPRTMTRDAAISMSAVAVLNLLSGIFGYLDFREEVTGSILLYYTPRQDALFFISYIGICIKLCVGFAICIQPSRDAIYYCLRWGKTSDVRYWVNWIVSGVLAVAALICAFFIPDITIVFSLLGGICGCFLAFMLPAYYYMYSGDFTLKKKGIWHYIGCFLLLVAGAVSLVFGTAAAIYAEID